MSDSLDNSNGTRALAAVILAAGKGTRMPGDLPKVVHEVAGRPMIRWVVEAVREAGARPIVLVVGYGAERVRSVFGPAEVDGWAEQDPQLGTGHAVRCAGPVLETFTGDVLVLAGDGPLIRPSTIATLVESHRARHAAATLATATVADPTGYGRVVRDEDGRFLAIVEHADATETQRRIHEIYPSYACFDAGLLFEVLEGLAPDKASGEFRITDVPAVLRSQGHAVEIVNGFPPEETLSVNTPQQLREVDEILSCRLEATR